MMMVLWLSRLTEPNGISRIGELNKKFSFFRVQKEKRGDPLLGLLEENLLDVLAVKVSLVRRPLLEKEEDTSERNLKWSDCM